MKNITVLELINKDMNAGLEGYMKIQSNRETIKSEFYYEPDLIGEAFRNLTVAE